ncbi:LCP family protein [Bacillus cereus]
MSNKSRFKIKFKKRSTKMIIIIGTILLLVLGSYAAITFNKASFVMKNAYQKIGGTEREVDPVSDHVSILIMGVDESEERSKEYGEAIRTDALLLATLNKDSNSIKLVSIPRDTYTYLSGIQKMGKINEAHARRNIETGKIEGPVATIRDVENLLDVPINYFIKFNFNSFMKIVEDLNGIDVDVPVEFTEQDSHGVADAIHLQKGKQSLNGEQALALARTRHIDSDAMRGQRQQLVIEAIIKKIVSFDGLTKSQKILEDINGEFVTNLSFGNILSIGNQYGKGASIEKLQLAGEDYDAYPNGKHVYYYKPDEAKLLELTQQLRSHLALPAQEKNRETIAQ